MSFTNRMKGVADKLLRKFDESDGRIVLVKKGGEPVWDEQLGEMVIPPSVDVPMIGVTVPFAVNLVNGTTIQAGDVQVIAQAIDPVYGGISQQDKVRIDGVEWSIVGQPLVDYTGVTICHKLQCRR